MTSTDPSRVRFLGFSLLALAVSACTSQHISNSSPNCTTIANTANCTPAAAQTLQTLKGNLVLNGTSPGLWLGLQQGPEHMTRLVLPAGQEIASYAKLINQKVKVVGTSAPAQLNRPQILIQSIEADSAP